MRAAAEAEAERAATDAEEVPRTNSGLRQLVAKIKLELLRLRYLRKYSPNQPRVPAGLPDGGQWTTGGGGGGRSDPRVLSDATPDNDWKPGAQYAQNRGGGRGRGGQREATPAQQARRAAAEARAQEALRRVRELDPNWQPSVSLTAPGSTEGEIARAEQQTREAEARLSELARGADLASGADLGVVQQQSLQGKVQSYLLEPNNPRNGGKAEWFSRALGFDQNNWQDLAAQIRYDETTAVFQRNSPYGARYEQVTPIVGANGRTIEVPLVFQRNFDGTMSFITAKPGRR